MSKIFSSKMLDPEVLKSKAIESLESFDPGLVLRGVQLTIVGAYRALQNPNLFQSQHYKQAAFAVLAGLIVRFVVDLPILIVRAVLLICGLFTDIKSKSWDKKILSGLSFIEKNVLQIPFFVMTYTSWHLTTALDDMFMESLNWVDETYMRKHARDEPASLRGLYYPNLVLWSKQSKTVSPNQRKSSARNQFLNKALRKGLISLLVYFSSLVPVLGKIVLPAASAYSLKGPAGIGPAVAIFVAGLFVPRRYLIILLQAYYASRSLVRQLLEPYFSRVSFTAAEKKRWFRDREGLLFGFGVGFYLLLKIPLMGVLVYGIAEASTAYLLTKITDPPPNPTQGDGYAASQAKWQSKTVFMRLPVHKLDEQDLNPSSTHIPAQNLGAGARQRDGKRVLQEN